MEEVQNPTMRGRRLSRKLFDDDFDAVNSTFAESDDFCMQTSIIAMIISSSYKHQTLHYRI